MEVISKVNINYHKPDLFRLKAIGDIHGGSIHCDEDFIKGEVQKTAKDKYSKVILMGDLADCIIKDDKRFDMKGLAKWVEPDNIVESQREWVVKLFKPIASQIICILEGNHEQAIHSKFQFDFTRNVCKDLNVTYGGYQCLIPIVFDRTVTKESHQYIVHAWHGAGAAASEGGRMMRLMRLVNEIEARIYLMGHLHATTVYRADRLALRNGHIKSQPIVACMTGSALKSYQQNSPTSYAERFGYKPSVIGFPTILISPNQDQILVEV